MINPIAPTALADRAVAFILTPPPILPTQLPSQDTDTPARKLLRGLLRVAIMDARGVRRTVLPERVAEFAANQADALDWFGSEDTAPWSFRWTCEHLGVDPRRVRALVDSGARGVPVRQRRAA